MAEAQDPSEFRAAHLRQDDFLGAFGLLRRSGSVLLVANARRIAGQPRQTWDLPGGQVEPGESLAEALARELAEEICIEVRGEPEFLFVQEGLKYSGAARSYAWRSFFFAVDEYQGEPRASTEVQGLRWVAEAELEAVLDAPYHDSFLAWWRGGGRLYRSLWRD